MNNNIFSNFKMPIMMNTPQNVLQNASQNMPVQNTEEQSQKYNQMTTNSLIVAGSAGIGAAGGFAYYKVKEPYLLKTAKESADTFKKTLENSFDEQEVTQLTRKIINQLEKNLDNNLLAQKKAKKIMESVELPSQKFIANETLISLENECKEISKNIKIKKADYENLKTRTVIEPVKEFFENELEKIGKNKKISIIVGAMVGIVTGASIVATKILHDRRIKK